MVNRARSSLFVSGGTIYDVAGNPHTSMTVLDGRVVSFDVDNPASPALNLAGQTAIGGFCDAHIHLFALIDRFAGVDCTLVDSLDALLTVLADAPGDGWVRASGYDLGDLHPTKDDLDRAVPHRPVRLVHRSGHLAIVNSAGLAAIPDHVLAVGRDRGLLDLDDDGEPTGLIWDPGEWFSNAVLPPLSDNEINRGLRQAEFVLLSNGIVAVHDASPANNRDRYDLWQRLPAAFRMLVLPGERHIDQFPGATEDDWLRIGPVKVVLPDMPDDLPPLTAFVERIRAIGRPVAVHAVVHQAVRLAVEAARFVPLRIEHGAEWPDDLLQHSRGLTAVTHPVWVRDRAARYLESVPPEVQPWLHRGQSLQDAGVRLFFGADFPAGRIDAWGAIETAVTRRAAGGTMLNPAEAMSIQDAIGASTAGGSVFAGGVAPLSIGGWADFQVLPGDPFKTTDLASIRPTAVYIAGTLAWSG